VPRILFCDNFCQYEFDLCFVLKLLKPVNVMLLGLIWHIELLQKNTKSSSSRLTFSLSSSPHLFYWIFGTEETLMHKARKLSESLHAIEYGKNKKNTLQV